MPAVAHPDGSAIQANVHSAIQRLGFGFFGVADAGFAGGTSSTSQRNGEEICSSTSSTSTEGGSFLDKGKAEPYPACLLSFLVNSALLVPAAKMSSLAQPHGFEFLAA